MKNISSILCFMLILSTNAYAEDLSAKIDALSAKIDNMQSAIMMKLEQINSQGGAGGNEEAAKVAMSEIQNLLSSNQFDAAKTKIADFQKRFAGTQYAGSVERIKSELDVIGKAAPTKWNIEKWYQFEKDINLDSDKPTFIVFWEVWCPHCRREVPKIVELKNALKDVQFVGITKLSRGTTESELDGFLKENKVNYPIAKENGELSPYFSVNGVPAAVLLKNKKVVWRGHPALATAENIQSWLK